MKKFILVHWLKSYSPSNLNRDDLGRAKSVQWGNAKRLRISSQCIKRALRISETFGGEFELESVRTNRMAEHLLETYRNTGQYDEKTVAEAAIIIQMILREGDCSEFLTTGRGRSYSIEDVLKSFRKDYEDNPEKALEDASHFKTKEIFHFHTHEKYGAIQAMEMLCEYGIPSEEDYDSDNEAVEELFKNLVLTIKQDGDPLRVADVALHGRMFTSGSNENVSGAVKVSHMVSTHESVPEDDFFTAVDDLNLGSGSAHMGSKYYSSGVMYGFAAIDTELLRDNLELLSGQSVSDEQVIKIIETWFKAIVVENPSGSQTSMASIPYADYVRVEKTDAQPCSYQRAFLKAVEGDDLLKESIHALESTINEKDLAWSSLGSCEFAVVNVPAKEGNWEDIVVFLKDEIE